MFGITSDVRISLRRMDETSSWSGSARSECVSSLEDLQEATNRLRELSGSCKRQHADHSVNNECHSAQSPLSRTLCDAETESMVGYVEPIEEDFPSPDENDMPTLHHTTAQLQTQTRRIGRTRKRTMCPCCTPGFLGPAVKSSPRLEEPEKWA